MNPCLLDYLCDPYDKTDLKLSDATYDKAGRIINGLLTGKTGRSYPIKNGVPRFVDPRMQQSVEAFGDQWNFFNYDDFYLQWRDQTVKNNFGKPEFFQGLTVVDAGAGHGMQSRWMAEAGAKHVIALELSHTIDNVLRDNIKGLENKIDVVQCSIDTLPLKPNSIKGMVLCHNVIQHTPSVEVTAKALWEITAPGSEFVWNCYTRDDSSLLRRSRFRLHRSVRWILERSPFWVRLGYAHCMATLRFVPGLGWLLEKALVMGRGQVILGPHYIRRAYRAALVITFDGFGGHGYQHHLSFAEQWALAKKLQPDEEKWKNQSVYFTTPMPISAALRLTK